MIFFRKKQAKNDLKNRLKKCNFQTAAEMLKESFGGAVIKKGLAADLSRFCNQPNFKNAWSLIQNNSDISDEIKQILTACCNPYVQVKKSYSLRNEPEFEEMCDAIADDREKHLKIKQVLVNKGYSEKEIEDEFAKYWTDLAQGY